MNTKQRLSRRAILKALLAVGLVLLFLLWFFSANTKPFIGEPLTSEKLNHSKQSTPSGNSRAKELLVFLGFSGGGTRAAALAYGVLQELAHTNIIINGAERRLLDEIDVISSVSGGSFTNAYFGLFGDKIFDNFKEDMLLRPIEDDLLKAIFNPINSRDLSSPYFGRSDLAIDYYDKHIFKGKTMGDIHPTSAPWIIINASDIGTGDRLVFTRHVLHLLCNDFDSYPIARAVAASSSVPGATTPVLLKNRAGSCDYKLPDWVRKPLEAEKRPMLAAKIRSYLNYLDPGKRPWLHLVDGGITDNLGLRQFYEFSTLGKAEQLISNFASDEVKDVLIISVNAAVEHRRKWASLPDTPSERDALGSMTHIEMRNYTSDTLHIVRQTYSAWQQRSKAKGETPIDFNLVEVAFSQLHDDQERAYLNTFPTSLQLDEEQVDVLIEVGGRLLRNSPGFQQFLQRHQAPTPDIR